MAAKRRRRIKIKSNSSLHPALIILSLLLLLLLSAPSINAHHNNHHHHQHHFQHQNNNNNNNNLLQQSAGRLCALLPATVARHLKLCKLIGHSVNADEAVASGASRGLAECRSQFRAERWNCTYAPSSHHYPHQEHHQLPHHQHEHSLLTSELAQSVGNRESGFLHAIAAAGVVHSVATACSVGNLTDCACDKSRVGLIRRQEENWKWGGCSNNIRHGMLYAKHLVELFDALHLHHSLAASIQRQQQKQRKLVSEQQLVASSSSAPSDNNWQFRRLSKRSLSSGSSGKQNAAAAAAAAALNQQLLRKSGGQQQAEEQPVAAGSQQAAFCAPKNQSVLTRAAHQQLIKALLAKNSLEKHHELRLAMNMHNNKIGRMAVAKNMEFRCRCHGLSGSCSLKTCWLTLPNFQVIGAYLKKKYEASVHLPSAVNVNKLIPMMGRNEISAILSQVAASTEQQQQQSLDEPAPEFAPLVAAGSPTTTLAGSNLSATDQPVASISPSHHQEINQSLPVGAKRKNDINKPEDEIPVNVSPMSQQQYQALLRDMKLCNNNNNNSSSSAGSGSLTTRDLQKLGQNHRRPASAQQQQQPVAAASSANQHFTSTMSGQNLKNANQHLSQLLHSNKDELVHLHKSPDYCEADLKHGFAGIKSRVCSDNPAAPDNCDKLCCGRGFTTRVYQHSFKCDCKFQYCCSIFCAVCEREIKLLVCN